MNHCLSLGVRCDWNATGTPSWPSCAPPREFDWLKAGSSSVQQQALRQLRKAFCDFFANPACFGRPRFRSKSRTTDGFVVRDVRVRTLNRKWSTVHVPKVGWLKFRRDRTTGRPRHGPRQPATAARPLACVLRCPADPNGSSHRRAPMPSAVGIDRGVTDTVATSDGELVRHPTSNTERR